MGFASNVVINATSKNGKDKFILYHLLWQVTEVKDFVIRDQSEKENKQFSLLRQFNLRK